MKRYIIFGVSALTVFAYCNLVRKDEKTVVSRVLDGDTYKIHSGGKTVSLRLASIDCPETGQAYGLEAKKYAESLVLGKELTVSFSGSDKYGRNLGDLKTPDGESISLKIASAGYAWAWSTAGAKIKTAIETAKKSRLGLWADANPVNPYLFRKSSSSK
jgi:micrococcal nuclease